MVTLKSLAFAPLFKATTVSLNTYCKSSIVVIAVSMNLNKMGGIANKETATVSWLDEELQATGSIAVCG